MSCSFTPRLSAREVNHILRDGVTDWCTLLDLTGTDDLAATAEPWKDRVQHVTATAGDASAPALLIRPDGYVAWAGADSESLKAALVRWFSPA